MVSSEDPRPGLAPPLQDCSRPPHVCRRSGPCSRPCSVLGASLFVCFFNFLIFVFNKNLMFVLTKFNFLNLIFVLTEIILIWGIVN